MRVRRGIRTSSEIITKSASFHPYTLSCLDCSVEVSKSVGSVRRPLFVLLTVHTNFPCKCLLTFRPRVSSPIHQVRVRPAESSQSSYNFLVAKNDDNFFYWLIYGLLEELGVIDVGIYELRLQSAEYYMDIFMTHHETKFAEFSR